MQKAIAVSIVNSAVSLIAILHSRLSKTMFLKLAQRLYVAYLDRLSATGEEDFDGLMQRAADAINAGVKPYSRGKSGKR